MQVVVCRYEYKELGGVDMPRVLSGIFPFPHWTCFQLLLSRSPQVSETSQARRLREDIMLESRMLVAKDQPTEVFAKN